MTLYFLRHGLAEPAQAGGDDRARRLTPEGVRRIRQQAIAFAAALPEPDQILCSPYRRARQTADIVAEAFGLPVEEDARLACGATVDDVTGIVAERGSRGRLLLVGHQPDVGQITQMLTGSTVAVREGALIVVYAPALQPHRCTLVGFYDPDVMVSLGEALSTA